MYSESGKDGIHLLAGDLGIYGHPWNTTATSSKKVKKDECFIRVTKVRRKDVKALPDLSEAVLDKPLLPLVPATDGAFMDRKQLRLNVLNNLSVLTECMQEVRSKHRFVHQRRCFIEPTQEHTGNSVEFPAKLLDALSDSKRFTQKLNI